MKTGFLRFIAVALASIMCLLSAGCSGENTSSNSNPSSDKVTWREEYVDDTKDTEKFVDTDGDFEYKTVDFKGPEGYVIVIPSDNSTAKESAEYLRDYYLNSFNISLQIVTDKTPEKSKEIIIGNTSRKQSKTDLAEGEISVFVDGDKLVFSGGHNVSVDSAVKKFVRLAPQKGYAFTFSIKTDFVSTMLDGYKYVWGDEYEGTDIDLSKWDFEARMAGTQLMRLSYDKEIVTTADGRLKLHAIRLKDMDDETIQFKVPYSVLTRYKMNYQYGYAEIRARMPFDGGVWPSFWGTSDCSLGGQRNPKYHTEIDIFEVFGSEDTVVPNIHKWYTGYDYVALHDKEHTSGNHTSYGIMYETTKWTFKNVDTIGQEYHTYGFEWTPKELSMYVDGNKYMTYDITKSFDKCPDNSGFHDPIYLMFNFHIFSPDNSYIVTPIENHYDSLPAEYYIDYIRLYQKPGQGKLYIDKTVKEYANRK